MCSLSVQSVKTFDNVIKSSTKKLPRKKLEVANKTFYVYKQAYDDALNKKVQNILKDWERLGISAKKLKEKGISANTLAKRMAKIGILEDLIDFGKLV